MFYTLYDANGFHVTLNTMLNVQMIIQTETKYQTINKYNQMHNVKKLTHTNLCTMPNVVYIATRPAPSLD